MDYGLLPPEINSSRIYAGPGAAPMLSAAAAWDGLCSQLASTAAELSAVISGLAAVWRGPSAAAMTTAATRYQLWLTATAAQAESTAAQARAAAAAFEAAFAATEPPELVAANRSRLAVLVATNLLGQNTPAIMATEAEYSEMWAQDAAAMYGYQADSAAATQLTPFQPAPQVTNLSANPQGIVAQQLPGLIGNAFQSFLSSGLEAPLQVLSLFAVLWGIPPAAGEMSALATASPIVAAAPSAVSAPEVAAGSAIRASIGAGRQLGPLSVPPSWAQPPTTSATSSIVPLAVAEETTTALPMPLAAGAPRGGTPPKRQRPEPEYGGLVRFITRPPAGG